MNVIVDPFLSPHSRLCVLLYFTPGLHLGLHASAAFAAIAKPQFIPVVTLIRAGARTHAGTGTIFVKS